MKIFTVTEYIRIIVVTLIMVWGFYLLRPFIGVVVWGVILAVALFPLLTGYLSMFKEKSRKRASYVFNIVLLLLLIVPTYMLVDSLFSSLHSTFDLIEQNKLEITPPPDKVKEWPVVGEKLYSNWSALSENSRNYAIAHKEIILEKGRASISRLAGFLGTILTFILSFIIAIILMGNAGGAYRSGVAFAEKLAGKGRGEEMILMARNTVRNVVKGILFVALIQAFLCFLGFKFMGIPAPAFFYIFCVDCSDCANSGYHCSHTHDHHCLLDC